MSIGLFLVVRIRDNWWIDFEGRSFGPLDTRQLAVNKAHELADAARRFGRPAQVMAPDEREEHWLPVAPPDRRSPSRPRSRPGLR